MRHYYYVLVNVDDTGDNDNHVFILLPVFANTIAAIITLVHVLSLWCIF